MELEQKPKRLPIVLLNIGGFITLIGSLLVYFIIELGETFGDVEAVHEEALALNQAEFLVIASIIYFVLCIAIIDFWFLKKLWVRWAILSLACIQILGLVYALISFVFILHQGFFFECLSGLWFVPIIFNLVILHQIFPSRKSFESSNKAPF